jgi:hypothetical protein
MSRIFSLRARHCTRRGLTPHLVQDGRVRHHRGLLGSSYLNRPRFGDDHISGYIEGERRIRNGFITAFRQNQVDGTRRGATPHIEEERRDKREDSVWHISVGRSVRLPHFGVTTPVLSHLQQYTTLLQLLISAPGSRRHRLSRRHRSMA